jgi:hypothetical protein
VKLSVAVALAAMSAAICGAPALAYTPEHLTPRGTYLVRCGGCHGPDGLSRTSLIPDLKDKAGYFLCDPAGRDYVSRLPNIVFSRITDAEMAALMNYVSFDLGGGSAPPHARAFTAGELGRARRNALTIPDLEAYRGRIVDGLIAHCGAPASLRTEYVTAK